MLFIRVVLVRMNEEISSTHEKLKSLADHLVESALSDASFELAAHLSPNMSVGESTCN